MRRLGLGGLVAVVVLAGLAACSDSDEVKERIAELRQRDLPVLVLPQEELGAVARGFVVDPESGPADNDLAAERSLVPGRTGADLERDGRITGYELTYSNDDPASSSAVVQVSTGVSLWTDSNSASSSLERILADFEAREGDTIEGLHLVEVRRFDVGGLGDEATGLVTAFEIPGAGTIYGTAVYTRIDRLGLTAAIISLDEPHEDDTRRIAETHEQWVRYVLTGEIDPTPIPVPDPVIPPENGESVLAGVALQLEDLPDGFMVVAQYLDPEGAGDVDFTREFEAAEGFARIGSSDIVNIQHNIVVFPSRFEAQAFVASIAAILAGDSGAEFLRGFLEAEGVFPDSLTTERIDVDLGDETVVIIAEAETFVADFVLTYIVTRIDTVVSAFIVVGDAHNFELSDIGQFAEIAVDRIVAADIG
jgi:hypothetical protein